MMASPTPTRIQVERRFPLVLDEAIAPIRQVYETAKRAKWDPTTHVPWDRLGSAALPPEVRDAARAVWSRRAWVEYTGLSETPALLIRFCLELDRESDPKYFLTVRNTEEAWHLEAFHIAAERFGGYLARPADARWEPVFNQALHRQALDADRSLEEYVAVHCAVEDGLELELYTAYAANATDPAIAELLRRVVADKARHAAFGWAYLEARCAGLGEAGRAGVARAVSDWIATVACSGYHVPYLSTALDAQGDAQAAARVAAAGLGAVTAEAETEVATAWFAEARRRLAALGIHPDPVPHPRLGTL